MIVVESKVETGRQDFIRQVERWAENKRVVGTSFAN
jgi:hypothetical protein